METGERGKDLVDTQVSVCGFDRDIKAAELVKYLENEVGGVWRCRLKTSWTPSESYPDFSITNTAEIPKTDDYEKVEPHAFVHFATRTYVTRAVAASGRTELFLNGRALKVSLGPENPFRLNQRGRTSTPLKLPDVCVEIGTLVTRDEFFVAWRGPASGTDFIVDPFDGTCKFCFTRDTAFSLKSSTEHAVIKCEFKVEFLVRDINIVKQYSEWPCVAILLQLASSPRVWYRTADDDIEVFVPFDLLDDDDPWIRTTDFTHSGAIGRCNSYRISMSARHRGKLNKVMDYLRERRVQDDCLRQPITIREEPDYEAPMADPFFYIHYKERISFEIMFLVNAVLHKGIFNQHQLSDSFFDLLRSQPREVNVAALKHIYSYKWPVFDAYKRLKVVQEWLLKNPKLYKSLKQMDDIVEIRRLVITPTKAYCLPAEVELSNRVLRKYKDVADRFLRVTFMDEGLQTMNAAVLTYYSAYILRDITSNTFSQRTRVFKRVKSLLSGGFYLCGRKYSFLAFSSNQLRDRSAWFFAEDGKTGVLDIKNWMGRFTDKNIAKCAARMGQCFSSTYATVEVPQTEVDPELPDIKRNGYDFSDGIGKITPDLATEVAQKLKLDVNPPPCAYQIRYAGYKGVVVSWPGKGDGIQMSLRGSMRKFQSRHTTLEICSWTRFQPGFLNRQIITLLSTMDVPDEMFWKMQASMVSKLNQLLVDSDVAFEFLTAACADQGNTAAIMLSAGFKPQTEPHLRGMLTCIRAAQLWGLREKARIFVPAGRWLMGCLDELGVLEAGQCFIQVSEPSLENCFSKHGSRFSEAKKLQVVNGFVIVGKNPCLHPGDIRILEAVDHPELHHLYDCLVFPQKGNRPHTNEASGSDLDGDLYFVAWDENLIPPSKKSWPPMEYTPAKTRELTRQVDQQDIIEFFSKHMVNESLGAICNAHVVHADRCELGALDDKCIHLAELAATAVDFPKTGKIVTMPFHLKPKLYPDFMGKEDYQSYKSSKILGRLYRQIKDAYDEDISVSSEVDINPVDILYDADLEVSGSVEFIDDAWNQKCSYDGQVNGLLGQYKVNREEELVTGHVWSMPKCNSRKQGELKERLKHSYSALRKEFRQIFEKMDSDFEHLCDDEKNKFYEQKASAWYQVTYHPKWVKKSLDLLEQDSARNVVLLSFAWIANDYLARIKIRCREMANIDASKPVNYLAKYVADRI